MLRSNAGTVITNSPWNATKASSPQDLISYNAHLAPIVFGIFLFLYVSCILYQPHFGLIDDVRIMFTSIVGKHLPFNVILSSGRFAPLEGQIYTVPGYFLPTPLCFYTINVIELMIAAWLLVAVGKMGLSRGLSFWPYLFAGAVMLNPGFIECWFRLFVPEKEEVVLLALFFLLFLKFYNPHNYRFFLPCILSAALALLCKETAFILVGGVGLFHLFLHKDFVKIRSLDIGLVLLSSTWLGIYYGFIYRHSGPKLYGANNVSHLSATVHTLASNALHDSSIIFCLLLLLAIRLKQLFICKEKVKPVLDSALFSCFFFYLSYLVLRMGNIYYLLPLYVFVPYIGCSVVSNPSINRLFRPTLILFLASLFLIQILSGMREVLTWKFAPANFQAVLKVMSLEIPSSTKKFNIYLSGSSRNSGIEIYSNLASYFTYNGLHPEQYDIKSDTPIDEFSRSFYPLRIRGMADCPFSFCKPTENDHPSKGDYILLTPYDSIYKRPLLEDKSNYQLVFATNTPVLYDPSIKTLAGHLFPHMLKDTSSGKIDTNFYLYKVL